METTDTYSVGVRETTINKLIRLNAQKFLKTSKNRPRMSTSAPHESPDFRFRAMPGDLLVALKLMRAWESVDRRGYSGDLIFPATLVLVLSAWTIDAHQRLIVMTSKGVMVLSSRLENMGSNWIMPQREVLDQKTDP